VKSGAKADRGRRPQARVPGRRVRRRFAGRARPPPPPGDDGDRFLARAPTQI